MITPRLRALGVVAKSLGAPRDTVSRLALRVWPTDIDLNVHLTNSRYAVMMDLGRLDLLLRSKVAGTMFRTGDRPIAVEIRLQFRKELPLGRRFVLESRAVGRDRKAVLIAQRFLVEGVEHAVGTVHVVVVRQGRVVTPDLLEPLLD